MSKARRLKLTFRSPDMTITHKSQPVPPGDEDFYTYETHDYMEIFAETISKCGCPRPEELLAHIVDYVMMSVCLEAGEIAKATEEFRAAAKKLILVWDDWDHKVQEEINKR